MSSPALPERLHASILEIALPSANHARWSPCSCCRACARRFFCLWPSVSSIWSIFRLSVGVRRASRCTITRHGPSVIGAVVSFKNLVLFAASRRERELLFVRPSEHHCRGRSDDECLAHSFRRSTKLAKVSMTHVQPVAPRRARPRSSRDLPRRDNRLSLHLRIDRRDWLSNNRSFKAS